MKRMSNSRQVIWIFALLALSLSRYSYSQAITQEAPTRPMKIEDLFRFEKIAAPDVSPDEKWVVYQVTTVTDAKNNKSKSICLSQP